jgi:hypothetical protein
VGKELAREVLAMRFIYICVECANYIGELELTNWNEAMLGFDTLTFAEKQELLDLDFGQRQGTVKAICETCYKKKIAAQSFYDGVDKPSFH